MRVSQVFQTCKHDSTSLVEMYSKDGAFLTTQCDICGAVLPAAPIGDAEFDAWFERRQAVPQVDLHAYGKAIDRAWRDALLGEVAQLQTLAKVVKGTGR